MPAVSKANSTSFKPGHLTWNKNGITKTCEVCNKSFYVPQYRKHAKSCSKKCAHKLMEKNGRKLACLELANTGLTNKEISERLNLTPENVASYLNRAKFRRSQGESYTSVIKRFKKTHKCCEICQFDRIIEAAHIIPVAKGGENKEENLLALCPNHHHLFDNNKLTLDEAIKLKEKVINYQKRVNDAI
jgi:5-methylcytosine-specific restriction endonuclease McrA